jgi:hypothetical protein
MSRSKENVPYLKRFLRETQWNGDAHKGPVLSRRTPERSHTRPYAGVRLLYSWLGITPAGVGMPHGRRKRHILAHQPIEVVGSEL